MQSEGPTLLYHITHVKNLPGILAGGCLYCKDRLSSVAGQVVDIAYPGIQDRRAHVKVPLGPGGTLHDYVPFYFAPRSPMLYTVHRGNVEGYSGGQAPIIHLVSSVEQIQTTDHRFVFTDGHAIMAFTQFFTDVADLDQIDWELMQETIWRDTKDVPDRMRRRQAEFLVYERVNLEAIIGVGVISNRVRAEVEAILAEADLSWPVRVRRRWYYYERRRGVPMIEYTVGNVLEADTEALVNTVNCVGVMGKGIALQFKQAYPDNFEQYARACDAGEVRPGHMFVVPTGRLDNPKYIINFPTKRHWRNKSRLEDIEAGLDALVSEVKRLDIGSIAVPPLGCGSGGLDWDDVRPLIEEAFEPLTEVRVLVYEPHGAPEPDEMPVANKRLKMTRARALFIRLTEMYRSQGYRLSRMEMQKLAYFLQLAGEPLQLRYKEGHYGPYAHNLNHVLRLMEGRYLRGYGDGTQRAEIHPLPRAVQAARDFLVEEPEAQERLEQVQRLIEGFETPYGMELLATVHWVAKETPRAWEDVGIVIEEVQAWSDRKRDRYRPRHIKAAWQRLRSTEWLQPAGVETP